MKRSEMIQHIYDELLTHLDHYKFNQGSDVWAEFVANELLSTIEGFGMLPPSQTGLLAFLPHKETCKWEDEE